MTDELPEFGIPLQIDLYDKNRIWQGSVGSPISCSGTVRGGTKPDTATLRLAADDEMLDVALAHGTRYTIGYRGQPLSSGVVRSPSGSLREGSDIAFTLQGDKRLAENTVAWVRPGGPIRPSSLQATSPDWWAQAWLPGGSSDAGQDGTTQGQYGYVRFPDGSAGSGGVVVNTAEAAIKWLISSNFTRLGRPGIAIAPDQGRGGDARAAGVLPLIRMGKLSEAIQPLLDWSGLELVMIQAPGSSVITVDVRMPTQWGADLTVESGIVSDGSWSQSPPNATRIIVGGPGEGPARAFYEVRDQTGLEADYNDIIEVFGDATSGQLNWPASLADSFKVAKAYLLRPEVASADKAEFESYLRSAGAKRLLEGAPTSSVNATLAESETFYFGGLEGVQLGDRITIRVGDEGAEDALRFVERVTEATFSLTTSDGFTITPKLGERTDDPNRMLARQVARIALTQRNLSTGR